MEPGPEIPAAAGTAERGPLGELLKSLTTLLATAVAIAQTRIELLSTELQEEMHRVAEIMVWTLVALLAAGMGLALTALVIVFVFWDTHRVLAAIAMTGTFFGIAIVAGLVLRARLRSRPRLLDATLAELAKDRERLTSRH